MGTSKSPHPIKRGEARRRAMLDAAWDTVMDKGFAACTLDDIISVSGGSKSTLYAQFGDKDGLLNTVLREKCDTFSSELNLTLEADTPPEETLTSFAILLSQKVLDDEARRFTNILMTEGHSYPSLLQGFLCGGPDRTDQRLARYLAAAHAAGRLNTPDAEMAANLFLDMILGRWTEALRASLLSGKELDAQKDLIRKKAKAAAELFLAATKPDHSQT